MPSSIAASALLRPTATHARMSSSRGESSCAPGTPGAGCPAAASFSHATSSCCLASESVNCRARLRRFAYASLTSWHRRVHARRTRSDRPECDVRRAEGVLRPDGARAGQPGRRRRRPRRHADGQVRRTGCRRARHLAPRRCARPLVHRLRAARDRGPDHRQRNQGGVRRRRPAGQARPLPGVPRGRRVADHHDRAGLRRDAGLHRPDRGVRDVPGIRRPRGPRAW